MGYITKGRGVSVHRRDCKNVQVPEDEHDRLIPVEWEDASKNVDNQYEVEIVVEGEDRSGFLNEVLQIITPIAGQSQILTVT